MKPQVAPKHFGRIQNRPQHTDSSTFHNEIFGTNNKYAGFRGNAMLWHAGIVLACVIVRIDEKPTPDLQIEMN